MQATAEKVTLAVDVGSKQVVMSPAPTPSTQINSTSVLIVTLTNSARQSVDKVRVAASHFQQGLYDLGNIPPCTSETLLLDEIPDQSAASATGEILYTDADGHRWERSVDAPPREIGTLDPNLLQAGIQTVGMKKQHEAALAGGCS